MIEGAAAFHYIGLVRCGHAVMMVYREGVLTLDTSLPGWGALAPAHLRRLLPGTPSPRPSPRGSGGDTDERPPGDEEQAYFDQLSDSWVTSNESSRQSGSTSPSGSRSRSPTPSPRVSPDGSRSGSATPPSRGDDESMPPGTGWSPPLSWLGWLPSDSPVQAGPVTQAALEAYVSAPGSGTVDALMAAFVAGQHAPHPPAQPAAGMMARLVVFGEPLLLAWTGQWADAGDAAHVGLGLNHDLACALVAHARVAEHADLNPVLGADRFTYLGLAEDEHTSVLVFDGGLLVQRHADPQLLGWHRLGGLTRWDLISRTQVRALCAYAAFSDAQTYSVVRGFLAGLLHWTENCAFAALLWSTPHERWHTLTVDLADELVPAGDAAGPSDEDAHRALRGAVVATIHDHQRINGPLGLGSGHWQVPVLLGALRCLIASNSAPELVHANWHATLQPAIERVLRAHQAREATWLSQGVIRQPVEGLLRLMKQDQRLRRPEVRVMWPLDRLEDLFKTLAPQARVSVTLKPAPEVLDKALAGGGHHLVVFQTPGQNLPSVVIAMGSQCWSDNAWAGIALLHDRVRRSASADATEHLAAIASIH